jgi:hypothetical protein
MLGILTFHVVLALLAAAIATKVVRPEQVGTTLGYLHNAIGITTPSADKVRTVALIWIGCAIIVVDGCLFLLVFITSISMTR